MKNLLLRYGLSAASSNYPCLYCHMPLKLFGEGMVLWRMTEIVMSLECAWVEWGKIGHFALIDVIALPCRLD